MDQSMAIRFDGQTEGYVLTSKVTITNSHNEPRFYNNTHNIRLTNQFDYIPSNPRNFIAEEDRIASKAETEISKLGANETVSGLLTFAMTNEKFEILKTVKPKYVIEAGVAKDKTFKDSVKGDEVFDFVYSEEQGQEVAAGSSFYQDRLTTENMAEPDASSVVEPGAKGEKYHVFLMRKDEFGLYKKFELEMGDTP